MSKKADLLQLAQEIENHVRFIRQAIRAPMDVEITRGGLTGPQVNVMQVLVAKNGLSLKDLSREVGMAHSTVSGIIDRLAKRGMVERQADEKDRRFTKIVIAQVVSDYIRNTMPAVQLHPVVKALARAKSSERESIIEGLRNLRSLMEAS